MKYLKKFEEQDHGKLILKAHYNLTRKVGKPQYNPTAQEIEEEIERLLKTNERADYINLHGDDEYEITKITRDNNHEYAYCGGILYELSKSGEDEVVFIEEVEHTDENEFYDDQVERYVEYLEDGGILESFPVQKTPLGSANNLDAMCEYLGNDTDLSLEVLMPYSNNYPNHDKLYYMVGELSYDPESYGVEDGLLANIRTKEDLDKYYGKEYKEEYEDEEYKNEDGTLYWDKELYDGFITILEYWGENFEYTLTDMNHRFLAAKQIGAKKVYVDPS